MRRKRRRTEPMEPSARMADRLQATVATPTALKNAGITVILVRDFTELTAFVRWIIQCAPSHWMQWIPNWWSGVEGYRPPSRMLVPLGPNRVLQLLDKIDLSKWDPSGLLFETVNADWTADEIDRLILSWSEWLLGDRCKNYCGCNRTIDRCQCLWMHYDPARIGQSHYATWPAYATGYAYPRVAETLTNHLQTDPLAKYRPFIDYKRWLCALWPRKRVVTYARYSFPRLLQRLWTLYLVLHRRRIQFDRGIRTIIARMLIMSQQAMER